MMEVAVTSHYILIRELYDMIPQGFIILQLSKKSWMFFRFCIDNPLVNGGLMGINGGYSYK